MHYTVDSATNDKDELRMSGDNACALRFPITTQVRQRKKPKTLDLVLDFQMFGYYTTMGSIFRQSLSDTLCLADRWVGRWPCWEH